MIATFLSNYGFKLFGAAIMFIAGISFQAKVLDKNVACAAIPDCNCPKPEVQSIDFEKVKNMRGTIVLNQHYHVEANGDSLVVQKIKDAVGAELVKLKLSRCK